MGYALYMYSLVDTHCIEKLRCCVDIHDTIVDEFEKKIGPITSSGMGPLDSIKHTSHLSEHMVVNCSKFPSVFRVAKISSHSIVTQLHRCPAGFMPRYRT